MGVLTQHDLLKLKILKSEIIKMNRGDKEEKKGTRGELKAETNLEFVVSLQEQPVLELKGKHRYRNPERICDFCFKYKYELFSNSTLQSKEKMEFIHSKSNCIKIMILNVIHHVMTTFISSWMFVPLEITPITGW